jgi:diadenosine tetraphosphatase ApaH/serine/threonine PP2A family protein phosphatase
MIDPALGSLLLVGLALLFASAAFQKFRDLGRFSLVLAAYRVMPEGLACRLAWSFPCTELAVALALPWPEARRRAALAAAGLLLVYAAGMSLNLARRRHDLDCGCTAAGRHRPIAAWMVWRNLVLALASVAAALPWAPRPLAGADLLTVAAGAAAAVALYAAVDRLLGEVVPRTVTWGAQ